MIKGSTVTRHRYVWFSESRISVNAISDDLASLNVLPKNKLEW